MPPPVPPVASIVMYPLKQAAARVSASITDGHFPINDAALRIPRTPRLLIGGRVMPVAASPIASRTSSGPGSRWPVKSNRHEPLRGGNGRNGEPRAAASASSGTGCSPVSRSQTRTVRAAGSYPTTAITWPPKW